jgi:pimeloyl-ACP methyl ester carboxylesterase
MLHCSASSARQWRGLAADLGDGFDPLSVDLCGHGKREAWHGDGPLSLLQEAAAVEGAIGDGRDPIHLIGHSYGGAVALQFARDRGQRLRSLTLVEPSCFHILKRAGDDADLLDEIQAVANAVNGAVIRGDYFNAMETFIDYWTGTGTWVDLCQDKQRHYASLAVHVAHHFWSLIEVATPLASYTTINVPTLILCGTRSPKPSRAITRILAEALPQAQHRTIRDANHMSPITHAEIVNPLILDHLRRHHRFHGDRQRSCTEHSPYRE